MFKINHYIITIVSLFCSLGIGILVGMSMGEEVIIRQQEEIIYRLEDHFEDLSKENKQLVESKHQLRQDLNEYKHLEKQLLENYGHLIDENEFLLFVSNEKISNHFLKKQLGELGMDINSITRDEFIKMKEQGKLIDIIESASIVLILDG